MPAQCSRDLFGYEVVEGRQVVAAFDGGDAEVLLLGATDRAIGLVGRFVSLPPIVRHMSTLPTPGPVQAMLLQRWRLRERRLR